MQAVTPESIPEPNRNTWHVPAPETVRRFAPGPVMVRSVRLSGRALAKVMVQGIAAVVDTAFGHSPPPLAAR